MVNNLIRAPAGCVLWHDYTYLINGKVPDLSGKGNVGSVNGAKLFNQLPLKGLFFDGDDDYILVPDSPSLDVTSELTIIAWIFTKSDSRQGIVTKRTGGTTVESYLFDLSDGRKLWFNYRDSTGTWQDVPKSNLIVPKEKWCMVGVIFNEGKVTLCKNTEWQKIGDYADTIYISDHPVKIGFDVATYYFKGFVLHVSKYNRALNAREYKKIYEEFQARILKRVTPLNITMR